jgi:hypothetical protein
VVSVPIKKPRKLGDLLASTLRGLINRVLINKMHSCCQAENLIDDDDQIEKLCTDFGHGGTGVWETSVFVAFILVKDRGRRKDFFDRHAFSWDKDPGKKDRTHKEVHCILFRIRLYLRIVYAENYKVEGFSSLTLGGVY